MKIVKRIRDIRSDIGLPNYCPMCGKLKAFEPASRFTFVCDEQNFLIATVCSVKCAKEYIKECEK